MGRTRRKKTFWGWLWRIALCIILLPNVLLAALIVLINIPAIQQKAKDKAAGYLSDLTGMDISIGHIGIKPPLELRIDDILAKRESQDTLLSVHELLLIPDMTILRRGDIGIEAFRLRDVWVNTDTLIGSVRISGDIGELYLASDSCQFSKDTIYSRLSLVHLVNTDLRIDIKDSIEKDTTSTILPEMRFDVSLLMLNNVRTALPSYSVDAHIGTAEIKGSACVSDRRYEVSGLTIRDSQADVSGESIAIKDLTANAVIDSSAIVVPTLRLDASESLLGISAQLATRTDIDLGTLDINTTTTAIVNDAYVSVEGNYGISAQEYDAVINIDGLRPADFVSLDKECEVSGKIRAMGKGIDPFSKKTDISIDGILGKCNYDAVSIEPGTRLTARLRDRIIAGSIKTAVQYFDNALGIEVDGASDFRLTQWDTSRPDFSIYAGIDRLFLRSGSDTIRATDIIVDATTKSDSTAAAISGPDMSATMVASTHLLELPEKLSTLASVLALQFDSVQFDIDTLNSCYPDMSLAMSIGPDSPFKDVIGRYGIDFDEANAIIGTSDEQGIRADLRLGGLRKDTLSIAETNLRVWQDREIIRCDADAVCEAQHGLPAFTTSLNATLGENESEAHIRVHSDVTEGVPGVADIRGDATLTSDLRLDKTILTADGTLDIRDLNYGDYKFGDRQILMALEPMDLMAPELSATAEIRELPLRLVSQFIDTQDISIEGTAGASMYAQGTLDNIGFGGEILPRNVRMQYLPYGIDLSLGNDTIVLDNDILEFNDFRIYGVEGTMALLNGSIDLDGMRMALNLEGKGFKPSLFEKNDSVPFYGNLAADISAKVSGGMDDYSVFSIINVLPSTDMTYMIDQKNSARASAEGELTLSMGTGKEIDMTGRLTVTDGEVRYSLPYYPLRPFQINKGSYVEFNGDIRKPFLNITATQPAKATVKSDDNRSRNVDFIVGLKVSDTIDNLALDFMIEAPQDNIIQNELASFSQEERSRIAAALLATGMYVSENNEAVASTSYALTSILQSRLNAMTTNNVGNIVDVDLGIGENTRNNGMTGTDYSLRLSKSFFADRLKVTVGGRVSDNKEINKSSGVGSFIDDISLQWLMREGGRTYLSLFHKNDYENVIDGELQKDGIGVLTSKRWNQQTGDVSHALDFTFEGNASLRSNSQIGPDIVATVSRDNMFGTDATLSARIRGAYYLNPGYNVGKRYEADTYNIGGDVSLTFPHLLIPWTSRETYPTNTSFSIGFMHENIAHGYRINKITANVSYQFKSSRYVSHTYSPFSLSLVSTSDYDLSYLEKASEKVLLRTLLSDEYIPAMLYSLTYDNSSDRSRRISTRFNAAIKESGNIISCVQAIFGRSLDEQGKRFIFNNYYQFVKANLELRNLYRLTERTSLATRFLAGAIYSYGNTPHYAPTSEMFYSGGVNSIRAFAPRTLGSGDFHFTDPDKEFYLYHGGDIRLEANAEYRFPLFKYFEGAVFLDAGNVWDFQSIADTEGFEEYRDQIREYRIESGMAPDFEGKLILGNLLRQTALGTGLGVRFVYQTLVLRFDLGVALHAPYDTGKSGYLNIPSIWKDGLRFNFAIGYPF